VRSALAYVYSPNYPSLGVNIPASTGVAGCFKSRPFGASCVVGTGFFVNEKGDVATADHVYEEANEIVEKLAAAGFKAHSSLTIAFSNLEKVHHNYFHIDFTIRDQDTVHDIAVVSPTDPTQIKAIGPLNGALGLPKPGPMAVTFDLPRPRDGDSIYACGYPLNAEALTTTSGSIATVWGHENLQTAKKHGSADETDVYRLDLKVNPGNSGGPVFEIRNGSVIGMIVEYQGLPGDIAIVVPSHYITELLQKNHISWGSSVPKQHRAAK
jgi:S1-C subfamily serine protease